MTFSLLFLESGIFIRVVPLFMDVDLPYQAEGGLTRINIHRQPFFMAADRASDLLLNSDNGSFRQQVD